MPETTTQAEATALLANQIGELAGVLRQLRADTAKTERRRRRSSWIGLGLMLALLGLTTVVTTSVLERGDRVAQTDRILQALQANQEVIKGCTTPGNACYDENQARSNTRLAPLIIKLCAAVPEGDPEKHRPPCT